MDGGPDHHAAVPGARARDGARHRGRRAERAQPADGHAQIRHRDAAARAGSVRLPRVHLLLLHRPRAADVPRIRP